MIEKTFYYIGVSFNSRAYLKLVGPHFHKMPDGGKFYSNLARAFFYESFVPRDGEWSSPWSTKVHPGYEMPDYDSTFNKTFDEVTDNRALDIAQIIESQDREMVLFYSGGIDSTVCVTSLLKNLNAEQRKNISICMSADSIVENPSFYTKYVKNNFNTIDSMNFIYSDLAKDNKISITADLGDALFGTELGTKMYPRIKYFNNQLPVEKRIDSNLFSKVSDDDVHYSKFKDIIVQYFNLCLSKNLEVWTRVSRHRGYNLPAENSKQNEQFGELLYRKYDNNIKTSKVPVHSLHDFFWWIIFNVKFMHCALRPGSLYSTGTNRQKVFNGNLINWYGSQDYQLWSMANNNNGQKIKGTTEGSYKWAARKYIYELDRNDFYLHHKLKIASLPFVYFRNLKKYYKEFDPMFGLDTNYNIAYIGDKNTDDMILDRLYSYTIDW